LSPDIITPPSAPRGPVILVFTVLVTFTSTVSGIVTLICESDDINTPPSLPKGETRQKLLEHVGNLDDDTQLTLKFTAMSSLKKSEIILFVFIFIYELMDEPKIEKIEDDHCTVIIGSDRPTEKFDSSTWSMVCSGMPPKRRHADYKDIDEIIKIGCNRNLYTMKEIIDFDDETFDKFYDQMLQFFNENPMDQPERTNHPLVDLTTGILAIEIATTQTQVVFALQIIINRRKNRRLERNIDLLLKQ
jgi:hypothetical protein